MTALLKYPIVSDYHARSLSSEMRSLLNRLRFHASTCRAAAYLDIHQACAVLSPETTKSEEAHMRILLRVLGQALEKEPIFLRPGEKSQTFDERWLIAVITARMQGDDDSFVFLMHRRIDTSKRRTFCMLISGLASILTKTV
jgi:hypothetical protein